MKIIALRFVVAVAVFLLLVLAFDRIWVPSPAERAQRACQSAAINGWLAAHPGDTSGASEYAVSSCG